MAPSPSVGETRQTLVKMAGDGPRDWTVIELQGLMEARDGTTVNGEGNPPPLSLVLNIMGIRFRFCLRPGLCCCCIC